MLTSFIHAAPPLTAIGSHLTRAARQPRLALQNLRYQIGLRPSREEHVFVVGPPRSGTTLVRQMLLAHPLLTGPDRETFFFLIWNLHEFVLDEIPPDQMADIKAHNLTSISLFDGIARWMKDAHNACVYIEKTPRHALKFSSLAYYFPKSRFIFVCRDPRDGYISRGRNPHMKPMTADQYAKLWRNCVRARLKQQESTRILDLRYEDLCAAPERHLQRMMAFVGYDMVPEQLAPHRYSATAYARTPGHARLNQEITTDTVGEWRMRLSAKETRRFTEIAGLELRRQGYEA